MLSPTSACSTPVKLCGAITSVVDAGDHRATIQVRVHVGAGYTS
jgi:hypothetical protein